MRNKSNLKKASRQRRKKHIRKVVTGTEQRPRLVVYRSLKQIYAQLVDDRNQSVLTGVSSINPAVKKELKGAKGKIAVGQVVGKTLAAVAREKGIRRVVFDRNGYQYHGRVKAVAEGARQGGLEF